MDQKRKLSAKAGPNSFRQRLAQGLYERDMRIRICYLSSANAARYVVNSLHQMDGYTWRVVHVAPLEHPFGEDEVMYLSVPVFFRVELERVG